jgi:hypothetical protein
MLLRALEMLARRRRRGGAHPFWTALTFATFLLRTYQRRAARDTVSLREEMKEGESLLITHTARRRG